MVRSPADGYTISFGHLGTHVVNGAIYPLNFDLLNDLEPVGLIGGNPMVIVSKIGVPAKDLKELIAWLKANDGKVTFGTAGVGSGAHFSGLYLQSLIGTKAQYVPYRGTGPAMQDLVAGNIDIIVDQASNSMPQIHAGKIRAYAVLANQRMKAAPDYPDRRRSRPAGTSTSSSGPACGCRRARRRTSSPSSTRRCAMRSPIRACSSGSPISASMRLLRRSSRLRRCARTRRPRSTSGGR